MKMNNYFDRAYINVPETYDELTSWFQQLDFKDLIYAVALVNPWGDGDIQLYNEETHEIYEKRTKIFIVKKTKEYILGMSERLCSQENMATFVSLRQLRNLIKCFEHAKKRISCYGLVYIYVIYTCLKGKSAKANECKKYLRALHNIIQDYLENNPDDELAVFSYGCFPPIYRAIEEENISLNNNQLPAIPRNQPRDDQ